ncbi:MAG: right-handed parallel beta-helix repeat-containing protein [Propioniciclava sp.]|uniref:right-handed parallel beta-helix repeat-containing protein n=1 Tax=Propioniciclava sp. TaxID=2038686 RepID=UPI0039E4CBE2
MNQSSTRRAVTRLASISAAAALAAASFTFGPAVVAAQAADNYVGSRVEGRGTVLGSASYAPPSDAVFVSNSGSDANPGTQSRPVKTVARALVVARSGGTIVLRAGQYHESVHVDKQVTIQNYPGEVVWFDGSSVVSNWTRSGNVWTAPWSKIYGAQSYWGGVRSEYPLANYPNQLFVDGQALKQVGSAGAVTSGTFFADAANRRLVIGTDPGGKQVVSSDLEQAMNIIAPDVTLRGFGVRRYSTTANARAAIVNDARGGTIENLVVSDNATVGLWLHANGKNVRQVTLERNGMMGMNMDSSSNSSITKSVVRHNNIEGFPVQPVAAGIKITTSANVKVADNLVTDTFLATGVWFDEFSTDPMVLSNVVKDNGELQVNIELSKRGIVANNEIVGGRKGMDVRATEGLRVMNNKISGYSLMGIYVAQDDRVTNRPSKAPADFAMRTRNNQIVNNVFGCGTRFQVFVNDETGNSSAETFNLTTTGNLFSARRQNPELNLMLWGLGRDKYDFMQSPADISRRNASWKNLQASGCVANPESTVSASALSSVATPLPSDVAQLLGVSAGTRAVGRITGGGSVTPTDPVAPLPPTESSKTTTDTFGRNLSNTWGGADTGETWALSGGNAAFSVSGGVGAIDLSPGDTRAASLRSPSGTSAVVSAQVSLDRLQTQGTSGITLVGRQIGSAYYGAHLRVSADGSARLYALRHDTGLGESAPVAGKFTPGAVYNMKVEVTGTASTTVRAKAWPVNSAEPSNWQIVVADNAASLQAAGSTGVIAYESGAAKGSSRYRIDNWSATVKGAGVADAAFQGVRSVEAAPGEAPNPRQS